jgi:hypothetical protein
MSQQQFLPTPKFEEYKERFKDFYKMQRRVDGVILAGRSSSASRTTGRLGRCSRPSVLTPRTKS